MDVTAWVIVPLWRAASTAWSSTAVTVMVCGVAQLAVVKAIDDESTDTWLSAVSARLTVPHGCEPSTTVYVSVAPSVAASVVGATTIEMASLSVMSTAAVAPALATKREHELVAALATAHTPVLS